MAIRAHRRATAANGIDRSKIILGVFLSLGMIISAVILKKSGAGSNSTVIEKPVVVAEFDTVSIPVPAQPVALGVKGKDIKFKFVSFPRHQLPSGVVTDVSTIMNSSATSTLPADLPLFASNFSDSFIPSNPVVEMIPAGMRAMTVKVDATTAVEGWAGSGAVVDVLLVTKDQTKVVAERVKILSAERSVSPVEGQAAPNVPTTVTLLVSQDQCLAINTAIPQGKIAFALRSQRDDQNWSNTFYTSEQLKGNQTARGAVRPAITGFVSVNGENKKFAYTDGRWVKTDEPPAGFREP